METIEDPLKIRLCNTCKAIDFEALATDTDKTKAVRDAQRFSNEERINAAPLGSLSDILQRSTECSLCKIIHNAVQHKLEYYHQQVGYLMQNRDPSKSICWIDLKAYAQQIVGGEVIHFNRFNVCHSYSSEEIGARTIVSLQACKSGVPSVTDDFSSSKIELEGRLNLSTGGVSPMYIPSGRSLEPLLNLQLIRKWISMCHEQHDVDCSEPPWIHDGDIQNSSLRMIDTKQASVVDAPAHCTYFALSYVWGPHMPEYTSLSNSNETYLRNLGALASPSVRLPKTILDAMSLVEALGYRYLWVDSLCIIQDDEEDKASQIAHMDSVYALAFATIIAADGSGAEHGLAGSPSNPREVQNHVAKVSANMSLMEYITGAYQRCEWNTRGWTMQEQLCSRRTIILTSDQAFWQCQKSVWCESMALEPFSNSETEFKITYRRALGCYVTDEIDENNFSLLNLEGTISLYSQKKLTNACDILNAIQAYLHRVSRSNPSATFIWGHLALIGFDQSLAFTGWCAKRRKANQTLFDHSGQTYKVPFPSWSWLGWESHIWYSHIWYTSIASRYREVTVSMLPYELEFFRLDLDGRICAIWPQSLIAKDQSLVDISWLREIRSAWKGDTAIEVDTFPPGKPFKDSGQLLFWTSKANLAVREEKIKDLRATSIVDKDGCKIGELRYAAIPEFATTPEAMKRPDFCFIVVARQYTRGSGGRIVALPRLHVLMIHWEDEAQHIASRITSGTVDEAAWVQSKPEWIKVTLQ